MAKYHFFRLAALLVPRVPFGLARLVAGALALVIWALAAPTRRRVRANLAHIPALAADPARLGWATRGVFRHATLNYLDFFRSPGLTEEQICAGWQIDRYDILEATMAQGRGCIVLSAHFGNFELGASRIGVTGYQTITPVEHIQPDAFFQLVCRFRQHHGLRVLPAESRETLRAMMDSLKHNAIVMIINDRHVIGSTIEASLFGAPVKLPTAGVALALRTNAPVLVLFCWRMPGGVTEARIVPLDLGGVTDTNDEPVAQRERGERQASSTTVRMAERSRVRESRALALYTQLLEQVIAEHPEQWVSALAPVWDA